MVEEIGAQKNSVCVFFSQFDRQEECEEEIVLWGKNRNQENISCSRHEARREGR